MFAENLREFVRYSPIGKETRNFIPGYMSYRNTGEVSEGRSALDLILDEMDLAQKIRLRKKRLEEKAQQEKKLLSEAEARRRNV